MDAAKLELILKKLITPKATEQSLRMGLSGLWKLDGSAPAVFFDRLCGLSLRRAVRLLQGSALPLPEDCARTVRRRLAARCAEAAGLDADTLLASAALGDEGLFRGAAEALTDELTAQAYALADADDACRLAALALRCLEAERLGAVRRELGAFLERCDCSGSGALPELLAEVCAHDDAEILARLLETVGAARLEELCGETLWTELDRFLVSGLEDQALWFAWIDRLFSRERPMEEYLVRGLWYLQLFAKSEEDVLPYFLLSALTALGNAHPLIDCIYVEKEDRARRLPWLYTKRYDEHVDTLWDDPPALSAFLELTKRINPHGRQNGSAYRILTEVDPDAYRRLAELLQRGCDCETVLKIFFRTRLKELLPVEDLLDCFLRYGGFKRAMEALRALPFTGRVTRVNEKGAFIVAPEEYAALRYHEMPQSWELLETASDGKSMIGKELTYWISGYFPGHVTVSLWRVERVERGEGWERSLEAAEAFLQTNNNGKKPGPLLRSAKAMVGVQMNFSAERFAEDYDFGLLTELLLRYPARFDKIRALFAVSKWNAIFMSRDAHITRASLAFRKYEEGAAALFRQFFAEEIPYKPLLHFYLTSIYKWILPFERFLAMADRERMLPELELRPLLCRMKSPGEQTLCRLRDILCGPVCTISDVPRENRSQDLRAICTGYELTEGTVTAIFFRYAPEEDSAQKRRGVFWGYIARNVFLNTQKLSLVDALLPVEEYEWRELQFAFARTEDAVHIRRVSGESILLLLRAMGERNPFSARLDRSVSEAYFRSAYTNAQLCRARGDLASILLNTPSPDDIAEIYLNTSLKFYVSPEELEREILRRRADLSGRVRTLYEHCGLTDGERQELFAWLDAQRRAVVPPDAPDAGAEEDARTLSGQWAGAQPQLSELDAFLEPVPDAGLVSAVNRYLDALKAFIGAQHRTGLGRMVGMSGMSAFLLEQTRRMIAHPRIPREQVFRAVNRLHREFSFQFRSNLYIDSAADVLIDAYGRAEAETFLQEVRSKEKYKRNVRTEPNE